jgi:hypothetical protein
MTGDATPPRSVSLTEFAAAARSRSGSSGDYVVRRAEYVIVNEDDEIVEAMPEALGTSDYARSYLNARIDDDPAALSWRLLVLINGVVEYQDWPRRGSPAERAIAVARKLSLNSVDVDLVEFARESYLRAEIGRLQLSGLSVRVLSVWWFDHAGEPEPVGLLIERSDNLWGALIDSRAKALPAHEVDARIAEAVRQFMLADKGWDAEGVGIVRDHLAQANWSSSNLDWLLVAFALDIADRLHAGQETGG